MKPYVVLGLVFIIASALSACGGAEERKAKYLLKAHEYFQEGNFPKARIALRNVLQIDPKDVEAYFLYAQVEEKELNWRNAFAGYQQVVELNPDHDRAQVKLAKYYIEMRALDQAKQIADRLLAKHPEHVPAQAITIAITTLSGHAKKAVGQAEKLVAAAPTEIDAALLITALYTSVQRAGEAIPFLRRALEAHPDNLELLDALATTLVKQGQKAEAESMLARIIELEPTVFNHRLRQVAFYDAQQQYEKAEAILREATRAESDNEKGWLSLAEYVGKRRGVEQGEAVLQQARKEMPHTHTGKIWLALGGLYESTRRVEKARELYREMETSFGGKPEASEAKVKLATLDWAEGKVEEAERQVQAVLKENSRSSDALLLRGKIALQRGAGKDAINDFRSVLKDQPEMAEGHVLLARAHLLAGEPTLARESLDKALAFKPTLVEAQTLLAGLDAAAGQFKEAKRRLDPLLARDPGNVALLGMLFQLQLQEKDWSHSQETLGRLRQAGADEVIANLAEGQVALAQQQWDAAEAAFLKAARLRPSAPQPLLALVQLDMRRGRLAQAQQRLETILSTSPEHPYAEGFLGELLLTKGEPAAAVSRLETATRVNPKWTTPWVHLARLHHAQKRTAESDAVLRKGLELNPENEQLRLLLAMSLSAQGQHDEAIGHYEMVLKRAPTSLVAANNLAAALVDHKGDAQSLERALALSRGFESETSNPYLLDTLGWAHHKLGHGADAVRVLQQATAMAPDHPILNYHLGAAYVKAGRRPDAITHLKKAVTSGTDFDGLDEAKALLQEMAG
jgi:tetratricopeptide (TPR) repeat protein